VGGVNMQIVVDAVRVTYTDDITEQEAKIYATDEIMEWAKKDKLVDAIMIKGFKDYVTIEAHEKSPIRRIRRITGYLSETSNCNAAKLAELKDRQESIG